MGIIVWGEGWNKKHFMNIKACNLSQFLKLVKGKQLFCIGSGKGADSFCLVLSAFFPDGFVTAFVDNDKKKWGKQKVVEGNQVNIISISDMLKLMSKEAVIVITCTDVAGVGTQLEGIQELRNVDVYIYYDILARHNDRVEWEGKIRRSEKIIIPKVIHYCWFGKSSIPDRLKEWMKSWKKYCPDYEIVEWNEDNYDVSKNQYMMQAYNTKMWGFVPDYARLDIIYNHGGIYLDTDVELLRNLDDLLYQEGYCGETNKMVGLGLGFGARKGLSVIARMRDYYNDISFLDVQGKPDITTCLVHQYRILKNYGYLPNGQYQRIENLTIFPDNVLADVHFFLDRDNVTDKTFSLHHNAGSWIPSELNSGKVKNQKFLLERGIDGKI